VAISADSPPFIAVQSKPVLTVDGLRFKDANGNGKLDVYEDWRRSIDERTADLVQQMTLPEKAGLMLIDTLNAEVGGTVADNARALVTGQEMRRFIFRNVITRTPDGKPARGFAGAQITPREAAEFTNAIQRLAEGSRLGIPVLFKSNARNHYERQARAGINEAAGAMSTWPKEAGLAATRDSQVIRDFAHAMGAEWSAVGLRGAYAYMADLATEPRWFRVHETFTEDADLTTDIIRDLVLELQGGPVSPQTKVALTMKHFPGGGPQELGLDPHYTFGKNQVYPAHRFADHLKPFRAAIDAGVSSIMPYYGVPIQLTYDAVTYDSTGMAFSHQIVTDLLRTKLGFRGYVNSDTGIIEARAWGLENKSVGERVAAAINAGSDVLSGFHDKDPIVAMVKDGLVTAQRIDEAVSRLLHEQFALGLFENPYVDAAAAETIVGRADFRAQALEAQRRSIVLLKNDHHVLPLPLPQTGQLNIYTLGLDPVVVASAKPERLHVTAGDADAKSRVPVPTGTDYALIRVEVSNPREITGRYRSADPATGASANPATGKALGAEDPKGLDDRLMFGGAFPWEVGMISFSTMAKAKSWRIEPSLSDIQNVMKEIGDSKKVVLCIYFRQPYVLDEASGLLQAGALVGTFGVSDEALMDVLTGTAKPRGKLPFALARSLAAVEANDPDAPGYPEKDTLFPFGFGLGY
jgi:beta-glucosidase